MNAEGIGALATLFGAQFLAGLVLAAFVPMVGLWLRLREEWLAALGLTHLAAAGGIAGAVFGLPALAAALLAATAGAIVKTALRPSGNTPFALMMLAGWCAMLLIAAHHPQAHALGQALIDGQLYFAAGGHLIAALLLLLAGGPLLAWLAPRLLREDLFPGHGAGNGAPVWRWRLGFDLLVAATVAIAALTIGIMATFALALLPAWIAFGIAPSLRTAAAIAAAIGLCGYGIAFSAALVLDLPFGPVLVATLLALAPLRLWRPARPARIT